MIALQVMGLQGGREKERGVGWSCLPGGERFGHFEPLWVLQSTSVTDQLATELTWPNSVLQLTGHCYD